MNYDRILESLDFGNVDAETDPKLLNCFIGTEHVQQALQLKHTLVVGGKGSGKSAIFRLLSQDIDTVAHLIPKEYEIIFIVPAYGIQSDEYLTHAEISEFNPQGLEDFTFLWLLYFGLKTGVQIALDGDFSSLVSNSKSTDLKEDFSTLKKILADVGLVQRGKYLTRVQKKIEEWLGPLPKVAIPKIGEIGIVLSTSFKEKTGMNILFLLDLIDKILKESKCYAWVMFDKIDLIYLDKLEKRKTAITSLVQLLIEYGDRFSNINLKVFLRSDIYRDLQITNKSHLVSLTTEIKWRDDTLMKLLVTRAVSCEPVRIYCQENLGGEISVDKALLISYEEILNVYYTIFEQQVIKGPKEARYSHQWILKRLVDGLNDVFPREIIHLGNLSAQKQRQINKTMGRHASEKLIGGGALQEAYLSVSEYRCDTYLFSEFPHLAKLFNKFKGSNTASFRRDTLLRMFEGLQPDGDEAIRALYDTGLLRTQDRKNVDACQIFDIPLLYRSGLGMAIRGRK